MVSPCGLPRMWCAASGQVLAVLKDVRHLFAASCTSSRQPCATAPHPQPPPLLLQGRGPGQFTAQWPWSVGRESLPSFINRISPSQVQLRMRPPIQPWELQSRRRSQAPSDVDTRIYKVLTSLAHNSKPRIPNPEPQRRNPPRTSTRPLLPSYLGGHLLNPFTATTPPAET